jgi:hypothetical protein
LFPPRKRSLKPIWLSDERLLDGSGGVDLVAPDVGTAEVQHLFVGVETLSDEVARNGALGVGSREMFLML